MSNFRAFLMFLTWLVFKIGIITVLIVIVWFSPISNILKNLFTLVLALGGIEDIVISLKFMVYFGKLKNIIKLFDEISNNKI